MKKKFALIVAVLALVFSAAPDARGQWVQTGGPWNGGAEMLCIAESGTNASTLFAGSYYDGFLRSTDSGTTWSVADSGLPENAIIQALAVSRTNASPEMLFAGTDSGAYSSTDEGMSWTGVNNGLTYPAIYALAVNGTNTSSPILFAGTFRGGVFCSTDNGTNWTAASNGFPPDSWVTALIVTDTNPSSPMLFAGTGTGAYRSTNNGASWNAVNGGIPGADLTVSAFAITGVNTPTPQLFAGTNDSIFLTTNEGTNWNSVNNGLPASFIYALVASNSNTSSATLFAAIGGSVFLSSDHGVSWQDVGVGLPATFVYALAVSGSYLFAGTESDVWRRPLSQMISSGVEEPAPSAKPLLCAYPNPCSQSTTISFTSPESGVATVAIVNILGATVAGIFSGELDAGAHSFMWGKPPGLAAGVYECIVQMNGRMERTAIVVN
jgi:hypothetical protein